MQRAYYVYMCVCVRVCVAQLLDARRKFLKQPGEIVTVGEGGSETSFFTTVKRQREIAPPRI